MATNVVIANGVQPSTTSATSLYTAPASSGGTRIIAFTACNSTAATHSYSAWIVPSGGSADDTNKIISDASMVADASDSPAEIINHLIPPSGQLYVAVDTGTTINFRATGIQF